MALPTPFDSIFRQLNHIVSISTNRICWLRKIIEGDCDRNDIFMARRLKELELSVLELNMELNFRVKNDIRGVQDNKCLRVVIVGLISILLVLGIKCLF
ncbi:hypothetical protein PIB30_006979 [Stylosanthes scabra]|uniref:Uncharacterized protein n=1 Tax=Stylosanthes scabra TaxID=79078 RepID=A0ABU6Z415_9FABA|nr:hypothetical protein [Stylosanthes scabra]